MSLREKYGFAAGSFCGMAQYAGALLAEPTYGKLGMFVTSFTIYAISYWAFIFFFKESKSND